MGTTPSEPLTETQRQFLESFVTGKLAGSRADADPAIAALSDEMARMRDGISDLARGDEILKHLEAALAEGNADTAQKLLNAAKTALAGAPVLKTWIKARTDVGEQIGALEQQLKSSGWPVFQRIGEFGLAAFTGRKLTGLEVAVREYDAAKPEAREQAETKLRAALSEMKTFAGSDIVLALLDENPMGVPLRLRDTLNTALAEIEDKVNQRKAAA